MLGVAMRFLLRNLHIFGFAFFSVFAASWVASGPQKAVHLMRPLVADAVEIRDLAVEANREIRQVNWQQAADEFVSMYVAAMLMPTNLFERLAERLHDVETELERRQSANAREEELELRASRRTEPVHLGSDNPAEIRPLPKLHELRTGA